MKIKDDINLNLMQNKVAEFMPGEVDFRSLSKYKLLIDDNKYFDFIINSNNGGFFFDQALQIYEYSTINTFNNIESINSIFQSEYGNIYNDLITFGQDLFGNQFCFTEKRDIVFFNSETGEKEVIANNYEEWTEKILNELEYFSGINILKEWLASSELKFFQRLYPKIPFIMGGEYKINNLFANNFPDFIKAYANIAKQVINLPNGTPVKLNIENK